MWHDAHADLIERDAERAALKVHAPAVKHTYGIIVEQDDLGITLYAEECRFGESDPISYTGRTFVPAGVIVAVVRLSGVTSLTEASGPP